MTRPSLTDAVAARLEQDQAAAADRQANSPTRALLTERVAALDVHVEASQDDPELYASMPPVTRTAIATRALCLANRAEANR